MLSSFIAATSAVALTSFLFIAASTAIEQIAPRGPRISMRDRLPGLGFSMALWISTALLAIPLHRLYPLIGVHIAVPVGRWLPSGLIGLALSTLAGMMMLDFLTYCRHRAEHAWFWPIHSAHHSPTTLDAANAYQHPLQIVTRFIFTGIPLSVFQFDGLAVPAAAATAMAFMEVFIHSPTEIHFGPLRRIFVDPRFHRVHHSIEERHFQKNFGVVFTLWDQLFGTAHFPAADEWPAVGVEGLSPPASVAQYLAFPLRSTIRERTQSLPHNRRSALS